MVTPRFYQRPKSVLRMLMRIVDSTALLGGSDFGTRRKKGW